MVAARINPLLFQAWDRNGVDGSAYVASTNYAAAYESYKFMTIDATGTTA